MIRAFCIFFVFCFVEYSEQGNCTIKNRFGKSKWFCCDNHEMINDTCHECPDGFESIDGSPCNPCKNSSFGRKCAMICTCLEKQMCNHINGCIIIQQNSTEKVSEFTEPFTYTPTLTDRNGKWQFSQPSSIYNSFTLLANDSQLSRSTRRITSTTPQFKEEDQGFDNKDILVYTICVSIFAIVILMCSMCQRHYKHIYSYLKKYKTINIGRRNIQESQLAEIPLDDMASMYEMIDESNMKDNHENPRDSNRSVTDSNDSVSQSDMMFRPKDENTHDNNSESSISPNAMDQTLSCRQSTSSSS